MFWNVHGKDIIFHSTLAFAVLLNMTKGTSKRTGIKCCLSEDKSSCIITASHLTCIFKHLAPNISIKWLQEASFGKCSASQAFVNRLDWLLENTALTAHPCSESRDNGYAFWKRVIEGCGFLQWCWLWPSIMFSMWIPYIYYLGV